MLLLNFPTLEWLVCPSDRCQMQTQRNFLVVRHNRDTGQLRDDWQTGRNKPPHPFSSRHIRSGPLRVLLASPGPQTLIGFSLSAGMLNLSIALT